MPNDETEQRMSATYVPEDSTDRDEPAVQTVGGVYVAVQPPDLATAEILHDTTAMDRIRKRRGRGPEHTVWADELDEASVQWAPDED